MKPIIIVGSGLAAYTLAKEFRKLNTQTALHIITADDGSFYSKPTLSNALTLDKNPEQLIISSAEKMATQLNASITTLSTVSIIDSKKQRIKVNEQYIEYQKLVLAVGAIPIRPPLKGDGAKDVFSVNNLHDYKRFHALLTNAKKIAIIGSGLIGCEFANDLAANGKQVTIIGLDTTPLGRLLPADAGIALQHALSKKGIEWRLGIVAEHVKIHNEHYQISLSDKSNVDADVILSAIGLSANLNLVQQCGIDTKRGIVVNTRLETNQANIYAIGDCAEINGQVLPFIMPLMRQARALAKTLNGEASEVNYPVMPIVVKTPDFPLVIVPPPIGVEGEWSIDKFDDGIQCQFHNTAGQLVGFALGGNTTNKKQSLVKQMTSHSSH